MESIYNYVLETKTGHESHPVEGVALTTPSPLFNAKDRKKEYSYIYAPLLYLQGWW